MNESINIRNFEEKDCQIISDAFAEKPPVQYQRYLQQQSKGVRKVLVADYNNEFAGYLTIVWKSHYPPFGDKSIPEIVDLNVLNMFQRKGIGAALLDIAENTIAQKSDVAGIGVGLHSDYGNAQRLYVKRGYIPDGRGISQDNIQIKYGDKVIINDGIVLHFTKKLK